MALNSGTSLRGTGFALAAIASLAAGSVANAQTRSAPVKLEPGAAQTVSPAQCAAFGSYVLEDMDVLGERLSPTFLNSVSRFVAAKCATRDDRGEIQLIMMTPDDAASLRTARKRMGTFDILGVTGVKGCVRPQAGVCPANSSSNPLNIDGG